MDTTDLQVDVIIPTQTKYLHLIGSIGEHIGKQLDSYQGDNEALAYNLNLVLTEATTNAIRHANNTEPRDDDTVRIIISIKDEQLTIEVFDHGQGFDLEAVPLPNLEQPKEGGLGLFFIKTLMDLVTYSAYEGGNVLKMVKSLKITP